MGLIELIIGALVGAVIAGVAAAIVISVLKLQDVLDWFYQQDSLSTGDTDLLAITIKKEIEDDNVTIVQGVFNKRTQTLIDGRTIKTNQLDDELEARHRYHKVVQYSIY